MFTGLIEAMGIVEQIETSALATQLTIRAKLTVALGDSVAVQGVCLTVTKFTKQLLTFDIMAPTWNDTVLKLLKSGDQVNLERALLPTTRLGGHFVSGHVDTVGTILAITQKPQVYEIEIAADKKWFGYIIPKGSIAIDGVSLTIQAVKANSFIVGIIPHTLQQTALQYAKPKTIVDLEFDMLAKYIENIMLNQQQQQQQRLRKLMR